MKRFYYHITEKKWANRVALKPRQNGSKRAINEPPVRRICVCDSVEGCFVSVYFWEMTSIRLYRTEEPVFAVKPYDVHDSHITGEHWLIEPTVFQLVNLVDEASLLGDRNIMKFLEEYNYSSFAFGDGKKTSECFQKRLRKFMRKKINKFLAS